MTQFLSKKEGRRLAFGKDQLKRELQAYEDEHSLLSKYHAKMWFQHIMSRTERELLNRYHDLALLIGIVEKEIISIETALYDHAQALEEMRVSNAPFKDFNFNSPDMAQTQLFT